MFREEGIAVKLSLDLLLDAIGIGAGNLLWLLGLLMIGVGGWLLKVTPESIYKLLGYLSLSTTDQSQGLPGILRKLVEPKNRTAFFGVLTLLGGLVVMLAGGLLIKICLGTVAG